MRTCILKVIKRQQCRHYVYFIPLSRFKKLVKIGPVFIGNTADNAACINRYRALIIITVDPNTNGVNSGFM
jgi:hypothetical protein